MMSRFLLGAGAGGIQVSSFAIISSLVKDKSQINKYVGLLEMSVGLGMIIGPSIGTLLYDVGGFPLNYKILIVIYFLEFILNWTYLPSKSLQQIEEESTNTSVSVLITRELTYMDFMKNKYSIFALCNLFVALIQWSYFDPVLSQRFTSLGVSEEWAGIGFLCLAVMYAVSCSINERFEKILGNKFCLQISLIGLGITCIFIATNSFVQV